MAGKSIFATSLRLGLVPNCKSARHHSLTVAARKELLSRARKQAVEHANFCNLVLAAALAVLLAGCQSGPKIVVGSKNFAEQLLLGEIAAQQIERRLNVTVVRKFQIGGTLLAHEALVKGDLDLYPEYTGTALTAVLKQSTQQDPARVLTEVRDGYRQWNLRWMDPLGFNNTFAMVVTRADADARHVHTLSDAGAYGPGWKLGAGYEFVQRADGLAGMKKTYGIRLAEKVRTMDLGLLYTALEQRQVDLAAANSTDGQLSGPAFVALEDDKHYFPPYQAAFVVREDAFARFPGLEAALQELSGALTTGSMRELNHQLEGLHRPGPKVTSEWLKSLKK
jgi:glycine betaine/choline ABC-type transport system substrate-binding protein